MTETNYCTNPNHAGGTTTTDPTQCDYARWKGYDPQDEDNACALTPVRLVHATSVHTDPLTGLSYYRWASSSTTHT